VPGCRRYAKDERVRFHLSKTFRAWKIDEPLFLPPIVGIQ